jgi:hypothetical protein
MSTEQERFAALTGQFREFRSGLDLQARQNEFNQGHAIALLHRTAEVVDGYIRMKAAPETIIIARTFFTRAVIECQRLGIDTADELAGCEYKL